jgi:hypothetical protein
MVLELRKVKESFMGFDDSKNKNIIFASTYGIESFNVNNNYLHEPLQIELLDEENNIVYDINIESLKSIIKYYNRHNEFPIIDNIEECEGGQYIVFFKEKSISIQISSKKYVYENSVETDSLAYKTRLETAFIRGCLSKTAEDYWYEKFKEGCRYE